MISQEYIKAKQNRRTQLAINRRVRCVGRDLDFLIGKLDSADDPKLRAYVHQQLHLLLERLQLDFENRPDTDMSDDRSIEY